MTNKIILESADDVATVWSNWHQDIMLILDEGVEAAQNDMNNGIASGDPEKIYETITTVRGLVAEKPINAEYSINQSVMNRTADLVAGIASSPSEEQYVAIEEEEQPERCDCFICTVMRLRDQGPRNDRA